MSEVKTNTIKAGYRIHVTTWENDADNYRTESMDGLTEGNVKFIVELLKLFKDKCSNKGYFGNCYDDYPDGLEEAVNEIIAKFSDEERFFKFYDEHDDDNVVDSFYYVDDSILNNLGITGGSEFQTRVFDRIVVEYIPKDIVIEVVTDKFI